MNTQEIRNAYIKFFEGRGHTAIKRAPLVLTGDPTTLFTGSGMQPLIPYLLGEKHPNGTRLVDSQTCLRAQDIDDVGDNRHTTFFEMLGNWSLGDYFKKEQIPWMFEFLSEVVGLDMSRVYVTCYIGDERYDIPKDTEAAELWAELFAAKKLSNGQADIGSEEAGYARGMKDGERIFYYDGSKNWWSRNGGPETTPVGDPCGPDSEMFYDFGTPHNPEFGEFCHPNCDCGRFMEIGNNVFMAYKKVGEGQFEKLEKPNVDHGSGLERIAAAKIHDPDVFKISLMWPIVEKLQEISGKNYESHTESMRVIADHLRAATFLAVDSCLPSNKEQGYVMRRLIRRAIRYSFDLGVEQNFMQEIVPVIASLYENDFPEVKENRENIIAVLVKEEKAFRQTLKKGMIDIAKEMDKILDSYGVKISIEDRTTGTSFEPIPIDPVADLLFRAYDTKGFPFEMGIEEVRGYIKNWQEIHGGVATLPWEDDEIRDRFNVKMEEQRNRSRTATKGEFKGGLGGDSMQHKRYHTATHLLQSALRQIFGPELRQHGSNITEERLRFDFNLDRKMTDEEKRQAEELVNGWIAEDLPVSYTMYPTQEALDMGAIGPFGERYDEQVKVYQMGKGDHIASLEICGGPHVDHTGQLAQNDDGAPNNKKFKITKEESSSAGIRRIKAVLQ